MKAAEVSQRRILDAATEEFAQFGVAGARVDRIAAKSGMSKPMIYTYFGSKEKLFDAVFDDHVLANKGRVPFTANDLPGYAVRLYDDYLADPALLRLVTWKRLERLERGYLFAGHQSNDDRNLALIAEEQRRGVIRQDISAQDVWSMLIATAATWGQNAITIVANSTDESADHVRRRDALSKMIRDGLLAASGE